MRTYTQLVFENISAEQSAILVAELSEAGYEGFEEEDGLIRAFIDSRLFDEKTAIAIAESLSVSFAHAVIEETNWNQVWESSFQPVVIDGFAGIRAGFHAPVEGVQHEIVITPKMSFGTGHHATTYMMVQRMRDIVFTGKKVFDFGTGTGILAILAEKLGAGSVLAIDNDDWSIANAAENIQLNQCSRIELRKADTANAGQVFDIILANINKHVIIDNFPLLAKHLDQKGLLVLSGLLIDDETDILEKAGEIRLRPLSRLERHNWLCLSLSY